MRSSSTGTARRRTCETNRPAIYTRREYDWTLRFQMIADALAALPAKNLILDSEAVVASLTSWTSDGLIREASFKGMREDKSARSAIVETAASSPNL